LRLTLCNGLVGGAVLLLSVLAGPWVTAHAQTVSPQGAAGAAGGVSFAPIGDVITDIRVEGVQRIEPATVISYLTAGVGDRFDRLRLNDSLKALYQTGLFADVVFRRDGGTLVVSVVENPIINRINFEGNSYLDDEALEQEIELRPRVVYTRTRVQNDTQRILDTYRRNGRYAATVEPKIIRLPQNRVDLAFEIEEGSRTGIDTIRFIGNQNFSDSELKSVILTEESAWYRIFSQSDTYDPDRLSFDKELLRRFYLSEGYADFRVVDETAELSPQRDQFFITFTVEEGPLYTFGKIDLETTLRNFDPESVRDVVSTVEGETYSSEAVQTTVSEITNAVSDQNFPFVQVTPLIKRDPDELTMSVIYKIDEGERRFVERIEITGNVLTVDEVIRRQLLLAEGDPFNQTKLQLSVQRVRDLGYFESVEPRVTEGSQPDLEQVEISVAEQATGEISFGAGFSTADGPLGDFSIRERNLFGKGQDLRIGATVSTRRQEYDLSFTEPYFLDRDLSAGFDIFRTTRNNSDESSFDEQNTGTALRLGYPLSEDLRQRLIYRLAYTDINDIDDGASPAIQSEEGSRVISMVGQELFYDQRNSKLNPTDGYFIRFGTDLAGLGGTARFIRGRLDATHFFPLGDEYILAISGRTGAVQGLGKDVSVADRFFLGGNQLRGFETAGAGPRDLATNDSLGGNQFATATIELAFPLGLPEEFQLKGHLFSDAGTVGQVDFDDPNIADEHSLRVSSGVGVSWGSPLGPVRLDFAVPIVSKDYDETELVRFGFGTRF